MIHFSQVFIYLKNLVLIILENILLGFDSPLRPPDKDFLFSSLNITITVFFIMDVLIKSLAYGFFHNQ